MKKTSNIFSKIYRYFKVKKLGKEKKPVPEQLLRSQERKRDEVLLKDHIVAQLALSQCRIVDEGQKEKGADLRLVIVGSSMNGFKVNKNAA